MSGCEDDEDKPPNECDPVRHALVRPAGASCDDDYETGSREGCSAVVSASSSPPVERSCDPWLF